MNQLKFYTYYMVSAVFFLCFACVFAIFFATGVHASIQIHENTPERLLDLGYVPASIISIDSMKNPTHVIMIEKASQKLFILSCGKKFKLEHVFLCSTGKSNGKKERSGDRKTPEGVYLLTKKFSKKDLSPVYGILAFTSNYPNFLDKLEKRNGNSIWIHGTNKPLKPRDSNGCIAMNDDDIKTVSKYIKLNRTPVIIRDKIEWVPNDRISEEKKGLLSLLNKWEYAFENKDRDIYLSCYKDKTAVKAPLWNTWELLRKKWDNDGVRFFDLRMKDLFLLRQRNAVMAIFDEIVTLPGNTLTVGTKKLYLTENDNNWKIIGEIWQLPEKNKIKDQRLAALEKLDWQRNENSVITELITGWIKAWSEKDLKKYISYYSYDFKFRNMNRKAWKQYKERLNKLYGAITISFQDLQVRSERKKRVVTFFQDYNASGSDQSNGYKAIGIKSLFLKRVGEDWKIYREAWKEI